MITVVYNETSEILATHQILFSSPGYSCTAWVQASL